MLDLAILGLLEERDLHGYEIRRQLREHLGLLANVSFGSIYPALTRLEKSGAVVATEGAGAESPAAAAAPAPPTGSLSGELAVLRARRHSPTRARRGRKVYRITDAGRRALRRAPGRQRGHRRRPQLRAAPGLRPAPRPPGPPRPARAPAGPAGPAPRRGRGRPRRPRRLRPLGRAAHRRRRRPRHQLARHPHRVRTRRPRHRRSGAGGLTEPSRTDTEGDTSMPNPIRLAIAGVGNCASSLVQGITYYRDADPDDVVPGPHARGARRLPRARPRSRWPPSTSTRPRSAPTSARRSTPGRTTRSASPRSASSA